MTHDQDQGQDFVSKFFLWQGLLWQGLVQVLISELIKHRSHTVKKSQCSVHVTSLSAILSMMLEL